MSNLYKFENPNAQLGEGECREDDIDNYFKNPNLKKYVACDANCRICISEHSTDCKICRVGYNLQELYYGVKTGICLSSCVEGYALNISSQVCDVCKKPCEVCGPSNTNCTYCISGFYLDSVGHCAECSQNCQQCLNYSTCISCRVDWEYDISKSTCVCNSISCSKCNEGFYYSKANLKCLECPVSCSKCTVDGSACLTCPSYRTPVK